MPSPILIGVEIEAACRMRENVNSFIKTYQGVIGHKPRDVETTRPLECHGSLMMYLGPSSMIIIKLTCRLTRGSG